MAFIDDGSRVCDSNRTALAAISADYTLTSNTVPVIFCAGIWSNDVNDRFRDTFTLHWRRVGGTFAAITNATEVKIAATGTVLVNGNAVSVADNRCNGTSAFQEFGVEIEGAATSTVAPLGDVDGNNGAEFQIALDFSDALSSQAYEFRAVVVHDTGTNNIDYLAAITTAAVIEIDQEGYRHRNDDQDEDSATWSAAQDTTVTLAPETPKRLRVLVNATGNPTSQQFQLEYRKVGDASWRTV